MGIKVDESLRVCNIGAQMLRIAEKLEEGSIEVEGITMVYDLKFKSDLESKYNALKKTVNTATKE